MSGGPVCGCVERNKLISKRKWGVINRYCNYSAFNGYDLAPSDYSAIVCLCCQRTWRTRASYVKDLRDVELVDGNWAFKNRASSDLGENE